MDKNMIDRLRKYYDLPKSVTDEQIHENLMNTRGAALISLNEALGDFKKAFTESLPQWFRRLETRQSMDLTRLLMVRPDLNEDVILKKVYELSSTTTESPGHYLRVCVRLGMKGEPMPWESVEDI